MEKKKECRDSNCMGTGITANEILSIARQKLNMDESSPNGSGIMIGYLAAVLSVMCRDEDRLKFIMDVAATVTIEEIIEGRKKNAC